VAKGQQQGSHRRMRRDSSDTRNRRQADGDVGNDEKQAQPRIRRVTGKRGASKENGSGAKLKNSFDSFLRMAQSLKTDTVQKPPSMLAYDPSS
jgi:hypothetical protein